MARSEWDKMLAGELYRPGAPEVQAEAAAAKAWMVRYNAASALPADARRALLAERLGEVGPGVVVRPPFHCDYGSNIRLGADVFLNFGCIVLDVVEVAVGEGTQIGPAVQLLAADHPRDLAARREGLEFGRPVRVGRHVWIGGGAGAMLIGGGGATGGGGTMSSGGGGGGSSSGGGGSSISTVVTRSTAFLIAE